jgi:hypothetical protein
MHESHGNSFHLSRGERSECEAFRVRAYELSNSESPSPLPLPNGEREGPQTETIKLYTAGPLTIAGPVAFDPS